jgi:hypothetical protein
MTLWQCLMKKDGDQHWDTIDKLLELDFVSIVNCNKPNPASSDIDVGLRTQIIEVSKALEEGEKFEKELMEAHDISMKAPQNMEELGSCL